MNETVWAHVDQYLENALVPPDPTLRTVLAACAAAGLPQQQVSPTQGKFLMLLALACGARNILEIGTLGGYSTIWLARALPPGGRLVTLEAQEKHAAVARANFGRAGVAGEVDLRVGRAAESLPRLAAEGAGPFDFVFIDADKAGTPEYFTWALRLSRRGTVVVVDNVVRGGAVTDAASTDPSVVGIRRFNELLAADPRVAATAIQTVGSKGYDGFAMAVVVGVENAIPVMTGGG